MGLHRVELRGGAPACRWHLEYWDDGSGTHPTLVAIVVQAVAQPGREARLLAGGLGRSFPMPDLDPGPADPVAVLGEKRLLVPLLGLEVLALEFAAEGPAGLPSLGVTLVGSLLGDTAPWKIVEGNPVDGSLAWKSDAGAASLALEPGGTQVLKFTFNETTRRFAAYRGIADLTVEGAASLGVQLQEGTASLVAAAATKVTIDLDPFQQLQSSMDVMLPFVPIVRTEGRMFRLEARFGGATSKELLRATWPMDGAGAPDWAQAVGTLPRLGVALDALFEEVQGAVLGGSVQVRAAVSGLNGGFLKVPEIPEARSLADWRGVTLDKEQLNVQWTAEGGGGGALELSGLKATIADGAGKPLFALDGGTLRIDDRLRVHVDPDGLALDFVVAKDRVLLDSNASPFTLIVWKGARVRVDADARDPKVTLDHRSGHPATLVVPGVSPLSEDDRDKLRPGKDGSACPNRFLFDVTAPPPHPGSGTSTVPLVLSASGVDFRAALRRRKLDLLPHLDGGMAVEGEVVVQAGEFFVTASAHCRLPFLKDADGTLEVRAASAGWRAEGEGQPVRGIHARFQSRLAPSLTDPSGLLEVRDPRVGVEVGWDPTGGTWDVGGALSGVLALRPPERFGSGAASWLDGLFGNLELEFHDLKILGLANMRRAHEGNGSTSGIALHLRQGRRLTFHLWGILAVDVRTFKLRVDDGDVGLELGGEISVDGGGAFELKGTLPSLVVSMPGGVPRLGVGASSKLRFGGSLQVPSGVRASVELEKETGPVEGFSGTGSIAIPGLPDVRIACRLGRVRKEGKSLPVFLLYADAGVAITLFPGVVMRNLGLGFGINQELRAFQDLEHEGAEALVLRGGSMPRPSHPGEWTLPQSDLDRPRVSVVAATTITASPQGDGPFPYVMRGVLAIRDDLSMALFAGLWLMSTIRDVEEDADFAARPAALGVVSLMPRHGRLEAVQATRRNPRMSVTPPLLGEVMSAVQTELALVVSPDLFRLRVGPTKARIALLGALEFEGQALFALEVTPRHALALTAVSLHAGFDLQQSFPIGSARLSIALRARFGFQALLAGILTCDSGLTLYARARVQVSVEVEVAVSIHFTLEIDVGFFSIDIDIEIRLAARLMLAFAADVEAVLAVGDRGTGMYLAGRGELVMDVLGFQFAIDAGIELGDPQLKGKLEPVRKQLAEARLGDLVG